MERVVDDLRGSVQGVMWSPDCSEIVLEVGGFQLDSDTRMALRSLFAITPDGSGYPRLLDKADGDYYTSFLESYLEWPFALSRQEPVPMRLYDPALLDYRQRANFLTETAPAQITRSIDSRAANVLPEVEGWLLTISQWGERGEKLPVKHTGTRLVAANP